VIHTARATKEDTKDNSALAERDRIGLELLLTIALSNNWVTFGLSSPFICTRGCVYTPPTPPIALSVGLRQVFMHNEAQAVLSDPHREPKEENTKDNSALAERD